MRRAYYPFTQTHVLLTAEKEVIVIQWGFELSIFISVVTSQVEQTFSLLPSQFCIYRPLAT